jgi:hypothetical protein
MYFKDSGQDFAEQTWRGDLIPGVKVSGNNNPWSERYGGGSAPGGETRGYD